MQIVRDVVALRAAVSAARAAGAKIGFVPTMGALHAGHLSLLDRARAQCECVVLSIFVNPLQFAPTEDLAKYPRSEADDLAAAEARGTSIAFVPDVSVMYPGPRVVSVIPEAIADRWEGAIRPGHFAGVLTVVTKLFNLVQPDVAVFGQKDLQQATLLRALARAISISRSRSTLRRLCANRTASPCRAATATSLMNIDRRHGRCHARLPRCRASFRPASMMCRYCCAPVTLSFVWSLMYRRTI